MIRRILFVLFLCGALPAFAGTSTPELLHVDDIPALVKPPSHGKRIIALWALNCAYCEPNLQALAKLQSRHPRDIQLVLVATDGPVQQQAVVRHLKQMHMTAYPAYLYAEAAPQRLNYLIDPDWGGETPRTLVIRADGTRTAISGELTPAQLQRIE